MTTKPKNNESKQGFLKRCTSDLVSSGDDSKKAYEHHVP